MMVGGENFYEVCIVGCGIAGSTLAFNLAPKFDVCMIEKNSIEELGSDPCGNAVHRSWFDSSEVEPKPSDLDAIGSEIDSIELHLPDGRMRADLSGGRTGITLKKEKYVKGALEASLDGGLDLIRGKGKPVLGSGEVQGVKADGKMIKAGVYVDASGVPAVLRGNFLPSPSGVFFRGYREIINCALGEEVCHALQDDPNSAFWIFPLGEKTNIGGVAFRGLVKLREGVRRLKERFELVGGGVQDGGFGLIPSYKPIPLFHENVVAIGDAGLTVNPVTGGGIGPSIKTSNLLAESLGRGESLEDFQVKYLEEIADGYEKKYFLSRLFLRLQPLLWKRVAKWAFERIYGGKPVD